MTDINNLTDEQLNRLVAKMVDGCFHEWKPSKDDCYGKCVNCGIDALLFLPYEKYKMQNNEWCDSANQDFCVDWNAYGKAWDWAVTDRFITISEDFNAFNPSKYRCVLGCGISNKSYCGYGNSKQQAFCRALVKWAIATGKITEEDLADDN